MEDPRGFKCVIFCPLFLSRIIDPTYELANKSYCYDTMASFILELNCMLCSECHLMVCMLLWKVYNWIFTVCYVRSVVFVYVSIALSVKAIWNCLLDFFQNGCSFQASCSVALLFSSSIVLLLYYDAFSFDKFIDSHDLLLPLSHN